MDYEGPRAEDLTNIHALNYAFLRATNGGDGIADTGISSQRLSESQMRRLCVMPFLLFSLREQDTDYWDSVLADNPQASLLELPEPPDGVIHNLQAAALGFLWQLSRRNSYVARLVSGAPVSWCERLAHITLVGLLGRAADRGDLISPRFGPRDAVSRRLLQSGTSAEHHLQQMSRQFAMQAMLTCSRPLRFERLPAAACALPAPPQRVAENRADRDS